jgi:hypothetical protein
VKLTTNAFVGLDGTMQGPAEYDNPFPPERGGWLMPFSDQLGRRSRHRLVRPSRRDPAWPHHLSDHAAALEPDHRLGRPRCRGPQQSPQICRVHHTHAGNGHLDQH